MNLKTERMLTAIRDSSCILDYLDQGKVVKATDFLVTGHCFSLREAASGIADWLNGNRPGCTMSGYEAIALLRNLVERRALSGPENVAVEVAISNILNCS